MTNGSLPLDMGPIVKLRICHNSLAIDACEELMVREFLLRNCFLKNESPLC